MQPVLARDNGLATYREIRRLSMVATAVCRLFPLALTTVWFYRSLYLSRPHIQQAKCVVLAKKRLFEVCFNEPPHLPPHYPCHYHCHHRHHHRHHHHHYHHHQQQQQFNEISTERLLLTTLATNNSQVILRFHDSPGGVTVDVFKQLSLQSLVVDQCRTALPAQSHLTPITYRLCSQDDTTNIHRNVVVL